MIDPVINEIIENFIKANLYPTKDERANISTKYNELLEMIPQSTFHMFQSGSYARTTAVTPVDDLDIICDSDNPTTDIALLFKLLQEGYQSKAHVVKQDHSIGVYFGSDTDLSIDVVPACKSHIRNEFGDFLYELPEFLRYSKKGRTAQIYASNTNFLSDPKGYNKHALTIDVESEGKFKKTVKFLKKWNYETKKNVAQESFHTFKSFHIEEIIKCYFQENPTLDIASAITKFFLEGLSYLQKPNFQDRADSSIYIDEYVTAISDKDIKIIEDRLNIAKTYMELLYSQDLDEIEDTLRIILLLIIPKHKIPKEITIPRSSAPFFFES